MYSQREKVKDIIAVMSMVPIAYVLTVLMFSL